MTIKRDNAYFLDRLEAERPDIWERYKAGEYQSVRAACIEAGLIKQRQTLPKMKTLWRQARFDEKAEFLVYLQSKGEFLNPHLTIHGASESERIFLDRDSDDRSGWNNLPLQDRNPLPLRPRDRLAIIKIMESRCWIDPAGSKQVGFVMAELEGDIRPRIPELSEVRFKTQDPSLARALTLNWKLRPALLVALDEWLKVQSVNCPQ